MSGLLTIYELEQEIAWREKRFAESLRKVFSTHEWMGREAARAVEYASPQRYDGDLLTQQTCVKLAEGVTRNLLQGVPNMDLSGLARDAAELDNVRIMLQRLRDTLAAMSPEAREAYNLWAEARVTGIKVKAQTERRERARKDAAQCHATVSRQHGHGRCLKKGTVEGPDGKLYCPRHVPKAKK